jgi:benzil reductase ((S)-benzoin forming)
VKKVILTGHSKGLGKALALALIKAGYDVLGLSRSRSDDLNGLQQVMLDLSNSAALLQWIESGKLNSFLEGAEQAILINNSGVVSPVGPLGKQANEDIVRGVALNVSAPLMLSNSFIENTDSVLDRRILHISSGAGRVAYASWSVYCATKAALDHHARAVNEDEIPRLKISSLAPGIVDTGMQAEIRSCNADDFPQVETFRSFKKEGDLASPEETAAKITKMLLSSAFGEDLITDVRDY